MRTAWGRFSSVGWFICRCRLLGPCCSLITAGPGPRAPALPPAVLQDACLSFPTLSLFWPQQLQKGWPTGFHSWFASRCRQKQPKRVYFWPNQNQIQHVEPETPSTWQGRAHHSSRCPGALSCRSGWQPQPPLSAQRKKQQNRKGGTETPFCCPPTATSSPPPPRMLRGGEVLLQEPPEPLATAPKIAASPRASTTAKGPGCAGRAMSSVTITAGPSASRCHPPPPVFLQLANICSL